MTDSQKAYQVKAGAFTFSIDKKEITAMDCIQRTATDFNLIRNNRSVNATLVEADATCKKITVEVEGELFEVQIKDELDQVLDKMGFGAVAGKQVKEIKAPMPGLVLEIAVTDGQEVNQGDKILILEAMKMENSIMIHTNATIKRIAVSAGQAVEKGQLLIELE